MTEYTKIPLDIDFKSIPILSKESDALEESINRILELIVFTPKGSFIADPEFGYEYWNHEFSNLNIREFNNNYIGLISDVKSLNDISRKQCEASLRESILEYEPRLQDPEVKVELGLNGKYNDRKHRSKYSMKILIVGYIDDGLGIRRPFEKRISFLVEPVAHKI